MASNCPWGTISIINPLLSAPVKRNPVHSKSGDEPGTGITARWIDVLFFSSLFCVVGYVLWLPVFPTSDGPMHIYYSNIFKELVSHEATAYAGYFVIRHLIQPYSLHYLLVAALEHFAAAQTAEKIFIAIIVIVNALGFRFLARQLGPEYRVASLLVVPLLVSWALTGGFLNFCFAVGVALFSFGLWYSLASSAGDGRPFRTLFWFLLSLIALVISHPVPQIVLIAITTGDWLLMWRANQQLRKSGHPEAHALRWNAVALGLACLSFLGPILIADKGKVESVWRDIHPHTLLLGELVSGNRLSPFAGTTIPALLYRGLLILLVPAVIAMAVWSHRRSAGGRQWSAADRLLLLAALYSVAVILFPTTMNGSYYFAARMWTISWPLMIATFAGASLTSGLRRGAAVAACSWIVLTCWLLLHTLTPIARRQAVLAKANLPDGKRGLLLEPPSVESGRPNGTSFALYGWAAARAFAGHHDVILNSPWLDLTIMPVKEKEGAQLIVNQMPLADSEWPFQLYSDMSANPAARATALADADFIFLADPVNLSAKPVDEIQTVLGSDASNWGCTATSFYAVCIRNSQG